jgi:IclR family acetate operon transcriptional repressor
VQSLDRALDLLEALTHAPNPLPLSDLAGAASLPLPTAHRLMATLISRGYARQTMTRLYEPGPSLIGLADGANRIVASWAAPHLRKLVDLTGETANLAVLDGDFVLYIAQSPSRHSMRMFTQVGSRVLPHCTGVGKALLSGWADADVLALLARTGMPEHTPETITDPDAFLRRLAQVRDDGYAMDDGEQELGVRCVAIAIATPMPSAISVSGPSERLIGTTVDVVVQALHQVGTELAAQFGASTSN